MSATFLFLLGVVDATMDVEYSRVIPRLYRWVCKNLRLSSLPVEHSVVVMTADSQSRSLRFNPVGSQFSIPVL